MSDGSRYLRVRAIERDGEICANCGMKATEAHHVVPLAVGGRDVLSNLVSLCRGCHDLIHDRRRLSLAGLKTYKRKKNKRPMTENAVSATAAALGSLGVPQLVGRFAAGEIVAANDPAVLALHAAATAYRGGIAAAVGASPGKLPTGTLRNVLRACGWRLQRAGRCKTRGADRDVLTYRAKRVALPDGVAA